MRKATRPLPIVFGVVVSSFVAATAFTHWRLRAIDRASLEIAENAAPSIDRLAVARGEMRRVQVLVRDHVDRRALGDPNGSKAIEAARAEMDRSIGQYLELPVFPGEHDLWTAIFRARRSFDDAVARCVSEADRGDFAAAAATARTDVSAAADALNTAITNDIELNARHAHDLALEIRTLRDGSMRMAYALDALCAAITIASAIALSRAMRAHAGLAERHRRLVEERAAELEQFAGRVAHDILSPLDAVGFSLELAARSGDDAERARYAARGTSALARVRRLVDGLLAFARAGAKPDASASCDVGAVLADLEEDLRSAASDAGAELHVETAGPCTVACKAGVLTSILANLARNAIKYLGRTPVRRIDIHVVARGEVVHCEVRDTGPGLPPGLEERVFEPYVRGPHSVEQGVGLGLATVKRLVEAHGGKVGVASIPGVGSTFWFDLPAARRAEEHASAATASTHA